MKRKEPPNIQCQKCKNYFPYYLQKRCGRCVKILCPPCTLLYQYHQEGFDRFGRFFRRPPIKLHLCETCYIEKIEEDSREREEETPEWIEKYLEDFSGDSEDKKDDENQDSDYDYLDDEAEYEKQNNEGEKIRDGERARSEFVCDLCNIFSDEDRLNIKGVTTIYFSTCDKCGISVCSSCSTTLSDTYNSDGSIQSVCKNCYESIEEENKRRREKREKEEKEKKERELKEMYKNYPKEW